MIASDGISVCHDMEVRIVEFGVCCRLAISYLGEEVCTFYL